MTRSVTTGMPAAGYMGYLGDVAAALATLPTVDRDELLETVAHHLESIAAEADGKVDRIALVERLGTPVSYAQELASAAGLAVPAATVRPLDLESVVARMREWPTTRATAAYLTRLVPAWWAVRGFLIGGVLLAMSDLPIAGYHPGLLRHWRPEVGAVYGSQVPWVVVPVAAVVVGSVVLGVRGERGTLSARFWNRIVDAAGVLALLLVPTWWLSPMFYGYVISR